MPKALLSVSKHQYANQDYRAVPGDLISKTARATTNRGIPTEPRKGYVQYCLRLNSLSNELLTRGHDIISRGHDLINRGNELISRSHDFIKKFAHVPSGIPCIPHIMAHTTKPI